MHFMGHVSFYLAALVFAVGVVMIYWARQQEPEKGKPLKFGGYFVSSIAVIGMACTGYYGVRFLYQGSYNKLLPHQAYMGHMGSGMMGGGMMGFGDMMGMMHGGENMKGMMRGKGKSCMMENMQRCLSEMEGQMMDASHMEQMQTCMAQGSCVSAWDKSNEESKVDPKEPEKK